MLLIYLHFQWRIYRITVSVLRWSVRQIGGLALGRKWVGLSHASGVSTGKCACLWISLWTTIGELIEGMPRLFYHMVVQIHPFLVLTRIDSDISCANHRVKLVSLSLKLFLLLILGLLCHHGVLVLPPVELLGLVSL